MKKVIFLMLISLGLSTSFVNAQLLGYQKHEVERYLMFKEGYQFIDQDISIVGDSKYFYKTPIGIAVLYYDDNICIKYIDIIRTSDGESYIKALNTNTRYRKIGYDQWQCSNDFTITFLKLDNRNVSFIYTLL